MKVENSIFVVLGVFLAIFVSHQARGQTKFSVTEDKSHRKQEGKKQIPTFVGSDGIVRKVSPAAILDEMKRCLPPGLPIPIATAWPELPPHLEDLQEVKDNKNDRGGTYDGDTVDAQKTSGWKKRVSRSNDKIGDVGDTTSDQSMNVKLEGPTKETGIFPPKDLDQNKMAEVLKEMLSRQMRRQNLTAEYIDDFSVRSRSQKPKIDEYEDYDYIDPEQPKTVRAKNKQDIRYGTNPYLIKRMKKSKRRNRWKNGQQKNVGRRKMNRLRKKSDYDYDYEESNENEENQQRSRIDPQNLPSNSQFPPHDPIQSDELEKQIELNDILEKTLNTDGIPERMENIDKFVQRSHFKVRLGENLDVLEGYQKMLAVVLKLNTTLIRLLDKLTTTLQKKPDSGQQNDDGKSSVIWDFMDLLMEQRRGARKKRENGPHVPENVQKEGREVASDGNPTAVDNPSSSRTNMDSLKWLLQWYLKSTTQ